jgi:hypothetical protein
LKLTKPYTIQENGEAMRKHMRRASAGVVSLFIAGAMTVAAPTEANAAGFLGKCYPVAQVIGRDLYTGGGWCDGNGPDWTYRGWIKCYYATGAPTNYGVIRWAGDRRQSMATCAGYASSGGGLQVFYKGALKQTLTRYP